MNEIIEEENKVIEKMIYEIRGVQVMLDSDLAREYKCANGTKTINLAVKRHPNRFPERFMFQLTKAEYNNLRFQFETTKRNMSRTLPYAFTEQGVAMLASVLRTRAAEEVSVKIMDAFVKMRHLIIKNSDIYKNFYNINNKLLEHDNKIDYLFSRFDSKEEVFLKGETFNAYKYFLSIIKSTKNELIVIDNYADISFLDLIKNISANIILITKDSNRLTNIEIEKYNKQYHNLKVIRSNYFHDRYYIVDRKCIYLSGTSFNNAGDKMFMIVKIENEKVKKTILSQVNILFDN